MIPTEERPNTYTTRVVIPPIIIPTTPKNVYRAPQPPQQDFPTGPKGCACGTAKIIGGCLSFPFVCAASCLAGTGYTVYHTATCNCTDNDILNHRNSFCLFWGCGTACNHMLASIESGVRDINRKPQVEEMTR